MSGTTNVPSITLGATGLVAPTESAILAGTQADINAAFGGNLNFTTTTGSATNPTPQGLLAASEAAIIGNGNDQFLLFCNLIDPAYTFGRMQDAIARIYFLTRNPPQPTVLQVACVGLVGVIIPVNALIQDAAGYIYVCTGAGTIPSGGSITLSFSNQVEGPVAVPATNAVSIYQAIPGWDSVSVVSGVVGDAVETSAAFEQRRQDTVEGNSAGSIGSIIGAVAKVPGVLDYYGYDNGTNSAVTTGGQTIAANSIFICVYGGAALAVAQAILSKKGGGCSYTGNTTVTAYDSNPLYSAPIPYQVTFFIPPALPIFFAISIKNGAQVPSDAQALIQAAINAVFVGASVTSPYRARIGSQIFASSYYAAIAQLGQWALIISLTVGTSSGGATLNDLTVPINKVPTLDYVNDIALTLV